MIFATMLVPNCPVCGSAEVTTLEVFPALHFCRTCNHQYRDDPGFTTTVYKIRPTPRVADFRDPRYLIDPATRANPCT